MTPKVIFAVAWVLASALSAVAAPPAITLRLIAGGFSSPVEIANAGDGSGRLFVAEQGGVIKIVKDGAILPAPFLDITSKVLSGGERGLLGLAFHPLYSTNGKFYVYYTRQTDGTIVVSEFLRSALSADLADPASERQVLTVPHPTFGNHNGGHMAFGPDGYLYLGTGDGGSGGDPSNNAQNLNVRLGKLLRIDVNTAVNFAVPANNPFVGQAGALPEIWAYGLRNPWKFSFDRANGTLIIADVGQNLWEEVNVEPAGTGGHNYGWRIMEGRHCFSPPTGCDSSGLAMPVIEYEHNFMTGGFAIVGGYVYRGTKSPALRGYYIYGDNVSNHMWAASDAENWNPFRLIDGPGSISTFGEDEAGELYVAGLGGSLYAIDAIDDPLAPATRGDFNGDGRADILWRNGVTGENYLYPMNGPAMLPSAGYLRTVADLNWAIVGIDDFDGDGKADVLWRNFSTGENYMYFMSGTSIVAAGYIRTVADLNWAIVAVGDFDGDGKADLLWRNFSTGENYMYFMSGTSIVAAGYIRTVADQNWQVVGVGDFDGDGSDDILWRNSTTGENYIYLMNGTTIANQGYVRTVADTNWQIAGVGDFDGDGKSDILWRNRATGENYIFTMDGTAITAGAGYLRTVSDINWEVKGTGDYDGDGRADILWRHAESGENYMYPMVGTTIKLTEDYVRTVADLNWHIQNPGTRH